MTLTDNEIEHMAGEYIAEAWEADRYYRNMNIVAFARNVEAAVLARAAVPVVQPQEPTINYAILQAWAETWNIDYNGLCCTVRAAVAAPLARQEPKPDAVYPVQPSSEAATALDAARYRWLTEDHADPATREKCRELLYRMPVMSYAAASNAIDIAMQEGAEE
jgi:hypothetical protein